MDQEVKKGFLGSPQEVFLAVIEDASRLPAVLQALQEVGIAEADLAIFSKEDSQQFDTQSDSGVRVTFRKMLGLEELDAEEAYRQALQQGHHVIQIHVPESEESQRKQVEDLILKHPLTVPHYFGKTVFKPIAHTSST
jgi:putative ubiquitin-RnfH superfamily antitoxin RatB of RatAB toxin-antitoxin module